MLNLYAHTRYFVYQGYVNMLKSFDGLCGLVTNELQRELLSGDVFIFFNRRRTCVKVLSWELDGFSIYYKRLERGTYAFLADATQGKARILTQAQLLLILQGISLSQVSYRRRYTKTVLLSTPAAAAE